ncbi:hypothetical protein [Archangium primigenium]|uniref:hypothetical protein n=1 Tax=[Archangium] primigenium TaxID=2792470 RepID=UPI00195DF56F|nr:hypothetical protein [Archangium primigenium]MBM7113370.1 hypothetical protein [Archangium primigenium]
MADPELVRTLRQMARNGASVCDMVAAISDTLRMGNDIRLPVIEHLRAAFGLKLSELSPVGAWSFFPGGTWSREEVERHVKPLILSNRSKWESAE